MSTPHSLIAACKLVCVLAGVTWTRAQPIYRALQQSPEGEPMLPLSRGRSIRMAEPKHVARFLMGLALTDDPSRVGDLVASYATFRPKHPPAEFIGGAKDNFSLPPTLEDAMSTALREGWPGWTGGENEVPTSGLSGVEFEPDDYPPSVGVGYWGRGYRTFRYVEDPLEDSSDIVTRPIVRKTAIAGFLFHRISREVIWAESEG